MTIASEIQDLQTNLQAAKTAVTTKGGTVGDTGLAGLATEIASIPSGGGGDFVVSGCGALDFYWDVSEGFEVNGEMCQVEVVEEDLLRAWYYEVKPFEIMYEGDTWRYMGESGEGTIEDFSAIGLSVTLEEGADFAMIQIYPQVNVNKESGIRRIQLTETDLRDLCWTEVGPKTVHGETIYPQGIVKYYVGPDATSLGDEFLGNTYGAQNIEIETGETNNITSIGRHVKFSSHNDISFPNLTYLERQSGFESYSTISLPALTELKDNANFVCGGIELGNVVTVGNYVTINILQTMNTTTTLSLPKAQTIGNFFSAKTYATNKFDLLLPSVTAIGNNFLNYWNCGYLNVQLPSITSIGINFMLNGRGYFELSLASSSVAAVSIGDYFLNGGGEFWGKLTCNAMYQVRSGYEADKSLSNYMSPVRTEAQLNLLPCRAMGFTFNGTYGGNWQQLFGTFVSGSGTTSIYGRTSRVES